MTPTVITDVRIFDGSGRALFPGEVRIEGQRITAVAEGGQRLPREGAQVIEGRGRTLMPGLVDAHCHLTWPSSVEKMVPGMSLPIEDMTLTAARNARIVLDHGFTSVYSGGALSPRLEMALKAQIDSGGMPGPRLVPSTIERDPPNENEALHGGTADDHGRGPEAMRAFIRHCAEIGAKSVKVLLSGESALKPGASHELLYTEDEVKAASEEAGARGLWLSGHAHANTAVKWGARHGFRVLYHCTHADEEALDLIEARKHEMFIAPSIGIVQATLDANPPPHVDMSHMKRDAAEVLEAQQALVPKLKARGIKLLPGGDYGFPFNPTGRNARDLELFVRLFGFTPSETLVAATQQGAQLTGMGDELGLLRAGYLADLLLVDGDPLADIALLQDKRRLNGIMKDGHWHVAPGASA